jgi:hypothetical protein
MSGRHKKPSEGGHEQTLVDAVLEADIAQIEQSIARYLQDPTDARRQSLLAVLEKLDDQASRSDAYEDSIVGSAAWGYASKGEVLGETSMAPVVDEVPDAELEAQVALVRAAKNEVRRPTSDTFAALRIASAELGTIRNQGTSTTEQSARR